MSTVFAFLNGKHYSNHFDSSLTFDESVVFSVCAVAAYSLEGRNRRREDRLVERRRRVQRWSDILICINKITCKQLLIRNSSRNHYFHIKSSIFCSSVQFEISSHCLPTDSNVLFLHLVLPREIILSTQIILLQPQRVGKW